MHSMLHPWSGKGEGFAACRTPCTANPQHHGEGAAPALEAHSRICRVVLTVDRLLYVSPGLRGPTQVQYATM